MDDRDHRAMNEELNQTSCAGAVISRLSDEQIELVAKAVVAFIQAEIPKIEAERNKYKEPYNHAMYMNTDRRLDGAKLFLEWVVSNYR